MNGVTLNEYLERGAFWSSKIKRLTVDSNAMGRSDPTYGTGVADSVAL